MIRTPRLRGALLAGAVLAALGGCVTLFPKEKPATLYRFGENVQPASAETPTFTVRLTGLAFDQAAAGDAIMTVTGDEVAYVGDGRWVSSAASMFAAAVRRGFEGGPARLIVAGEPGQAPLVLRLAVTRFEAHYASGPTLAPTVMVSVHASLTRAADQSLVDSKDIDVSVMATDNRLGPITDAFDAATTQAIGQLVGWVDQKGPAAVAGA